jgi:hypothetical protein
MLQVTNTIMKKSTLTILVLLILTFGGCGDAYKANNTNTNNNSNIQTHQEIKTIYYEPPKTIVEVVEELKDGTAIIGITAIESSGTNMQAVFTRPYNSVEPILAEYNQARIEEFNLILDLNERDIGSFKNSNFDGVEAMLDALTKEKNDTEAAMAVDADESLLVRQITVVQEVQNE